MGDTAAYQGSLGLEGSPLKGAPSNSSGAPNPYFLGGDLKINDGLAI